MNTPSKNLPSGSDVVFSKGSWIYNFEAYIQGGLATIKS